MRTLQCVAVAVLALVAIGCSSNNKGKIEGTKWNNIASTVNGQPIPAGVLTLDFKVDGGLVYGTPLGAYTGKYSLGMGDNVTLKLDRELAGRKDHTEKVSISGDRLTMTDSDGTAITFSRVK